MPSPAPLAVDWSLRERASLAAAEAKMCALDQREDHFRTLEAASFRLVKQVLGCYLWDDTEFTRELAGVTDIMVNYAVGFEYEGLKFRTRFQLVSANYMDQGVTKTETDYEPLLEVSVAGHGLKTASSKGIWRPVESLQALGQLVYDGMV